MKENQGIAVTISRQMGSDGSYIGYLVAKELGFQYVDREILRESAKHLGTDERLLEEREERSSSLIQNIARMFAFGSPETVYVPPPERPVYDRELFDLQCQIMNDIVDKHNAVIVGRGGFYALKDRPKVVRVFIFAPQQFRINRLMEVENITDMRAARNKVEESDQRRAKFIRDMTGADWTDARNYHLSIDSSAVGLHASTEMIIRLVNRMAFSDQEGRS